MGIETGDTVTFEYTARLDDGTVFDTSDPEVATDAGLTEGDADRAFDPLTVTIGADQVIPGLDAGLQGLDAGETATVTVPPEDGYGERDESLVEAYEADSFGQRVVNDEVEEGTYFEFPDRGFGKVVQADDEVVRVDFNHDLAGETLTFEVEITAVE